MRPSAHLLFVLLSVLSLTACDEFPRDPDGTLERVRGGIMRVGLLHNPPWVDVSGPAPAGVEVGLAAVLADDLDARIHWVSAGEADVLHALGQRELDLVIGGLVQDNPWTAEVAFTRPYLTDRIIVAAQDIAAPLDSIAGVPVLVDTGTVEPSLVDSADGIPVPDDGTTGAGLEAKPGWALVPGESAVHVLNKNRHVVAVPKGENAWLIHVDRFLADRGGAAAYRALRLLHE